jgi:hypothetical protein
VHRPRPAPRQPSDRLARRKGTPRPWETAIRTERPIEAGQRAETKREGKGDEKEGQGQLVEEEEKEGGRGEEKEGVYRRIEEWGEQSRSPYVCVGWEWA